MAAEFDFEAAFGCSVPLLFRGQSGPAPEQKDKNDDQQQQADGNDPIPMPCYKQRVSSPRRG
jgi:hypothetical protein